MNKLLSLFLLLIIITTATSAITTINAPAIDANGNGIVTTISATATPGTGKIRTDIASSLIAQDTEESIRHATIATTKLLKLNPANYDINIDINANAELIDGPSGGLALSLIIYHELNKSTTNPLRQDLTVTGTINSNGEVGPVGGVEEKIQAAAKNKLKLVLIAKGQSTIDAIDYIVYANELSNNTLQVIEVKNLSEAITYTFSQQGQNFPNAPKTAITQLNLTQLQTSAKTQFFKPLAQNELNNAKQNLNLVKNKYQNDPKATRINANIRAVNASIKTAQDALDKGYYYSAANTAFLLNINLQTMLLADISQVQFNALLNETQTAIDNFQTPLATTENFEEIAAAQLRYTWAKDKLATVTQEIQENPAQPAAYIEDVITARTWVNAATKMITATQNNNMEINEYNIRPLALTLLKQATEINSTSDEFLDHIRTAKLAIAQSNYISATYDLQYALAFQKADDAIDKNNTREAQNLKIENKYQNNNSIWAELYYANALYNYQVAQQRQEDYSANALRLLYLAQNFEQNHEQILIENQNPRIAPNMTNTDTQTKQNETPQLNATITVTPKTNTGGAQAIGLALIVIAIALLAALVINAKNNPQPQDVRTRIEKLDDALINGKISEETHKRLTEKYAPTQQQTQNKNSLTRLKKTTRTPIKIRGKPNKPLKTKNASK